MMAGPCNVVIVIGNDGMNELKADSAFLMYIFIIRQYRH